MKIVFLCGSLEPGHDGVGDYVRRLAVALILQNHSVLAIALNDHGVDKINSGVQGADSIEVPVLRLPRTLLDKQRFIQAKRWIDDFNPDFISLQFVIFSFHPKGLPFNYVRPLAKLGKGRNWHIMFHELWVGMPVHASMKHILWGMIQRSIIKSLIAAIKPKSIHTQTWLYQEQLSRIGVDAKLLPLFSNIPVINNLECTLSSQSAVSSKNNSIYLVIFGGIHPYSRVDDLAKEIVRFARSQSTEVILQTIGRCGPELERWVSIWQAEGLSLEVLGEQSPKIISQVLSNASIGITTTALPMIQKSGSVAAMREHGLPVLCISKPWHPRGIAVPQPPRGIFELQEGIFDLCLKFKKTDHDSATNCLKVSHLFTEELQRIV